MSDTRGSRWGRGSSSTGGRRRSGSRDRRDRTRQQRNNHDTNNDYVTAPDYISPNSTVNEPTPPSSAGGEYFVTSPPKKAGLTGSISTLFRRAASREPGKRDHRRSSSAGRNGRGVGGGILADGSRSVGGGPGSPNIVASADSLLMSSPPSSPNEERTNAGLGISTSGEGSFGVIDSPASSRLKSGTATSGSRSLGGGPRGPGRKHRSGVGTGGSKSVASGSTGGGKASSRLFYSSHADDDDSDDSFDTRSRAMSASKTSASRGGTSSQSGMDSRTRGGDETSVGGSVADEDGDGPIKTILRYRGFSTSIQNMFLDESLVCASMGCFGLILSNRTEYLLQMRNDRRGVKWGRSSSRRTLPSRIVAYALLLTLILIASTFVVWGFGNKGDTARFADGFYDGYNYQDDDANFNAYYDDQSVSQYGDDGGYNNNNGNNNYNNNYNYGNDDAVNNDDGNNDDGNNDDGNNDDGNNDDGNNDDANGDDGNNDDGYNDDYANNAAAADDGNYANGDDDYNNADDGNNGDDGNYNNGDDGNVYDDYYYTGDDDDGRRMAETGTLSEAQGSGARCPHRPNGIFKIRDMNEGLWIPAIDFVKDEWQQYQLQQEERERSLAGAVGYQEVEEGRDVASDLRISFIFAFLVVLGILGRRRRMRTRYYLVRARAQEDHLYYASSGVGVKRVAFQDTREDQYEGACSHTLCGCYPTDPPKEGDEIDAEVEVSDEGVVQRKKKRHHDDCVSRGFNCLMGCCCGFLCKCWFQCLSICALAQEAREVRLLLPTRYQRLDYITHQPFNEYQKDVNDLRRGWLGKTRKKSGIMPHLNALSRLSRYILAFFFFGFLIIVSTLLFNPRAEFSWPDAVVLTATFAQSFLVIYLVHWLFHKSDLSLDAVIKFFAAGFLIAVPTAFVFEGILVNITLTSAWLIYSIGDWLKGDTFVDWVVNNYRILWILGELVNAFLVAAATEELCKYYTFRCVEHPDLIFLTGLDRKTQDERTIEGGLVKYPFGSHQVEKSNRRDDESTGGYSRGSRSSRRSTSSRHRGGPKEDEFGLDLTSTEEEFYEDEHDVRTHRQKAAAVTTGMVSVAVGLACAENFLYVFLLGTANGKSGIAEEWMVLFFRSIFPVHALAAAMQSVNMIRKFVECTDDHNHRVGVGRIVLPAVLMHGSFDAILLGINVYIETAWDEYLDKNDGKYDENSRAYNPVVLNIVAWVSLTTIMLMGFTWYYRENRNQRHRLVLLEEQEKAKDPDSELPYTSPSEISTHQTTASDMELV